MVFEGNKSIAKGENVNGYTCPLLTRCVCEFFFWKGQILFVEERLLANIPKNVFCGVVLIRADESTTNLDVLIIRMKLKES